MAARAVARFVRVTPRKARFVVDAIRGKNVHDALAILQFTPNAAARIVEKLLKSAVANAGQKEAGKAAGLYVSRAFADQGFAFRKVEPRAMLRHGIMKRRTCHVTIEIDEMGARKAGKAAPQGAEVKA